VKAIRRDLRPYRARAVRCATELDDRATDFLTRT
jgi:hypothetical protein